MQDDHDCNDDADDLLGFVICLNGVASAWASDVTVDVNSGRCTVMYALRESVRESEVNVFV